MQDGATRLGERISAPWSSGDAAPRTALPVGATDCHHHILGASRRGGSTGRVTAAMVDDFRLFARRLGLTRSVVVATLGSAPEELLNALAEFGADTARGVAIVEPDAAEATLDLLHSGGVRGLRIFLDKGQVLSPEEIRQLAHRAADRGWSLHVEASRQREDLPAWAPTLLKLPCEIVIDHFGWAPRSAGRASATAEVLLRVLAGGRGYVKLSGLYLPSRPGPGDAAIDDLAGALVAHHPDRILWGSGWPHPASPESPDGAALIDRLAVWAPTPGVRREILVDNPARLYGWP